MATGPGTTRTEEESMTASGGKTPLRDVIDIPERAGSNDYVLKLTEGVGEGRLKATVDDYVLTDDLANSFDGALDLVADALKNRTSRAAFLAGSFGSGKSHFMAVLYALLSHEENLADARRAARAKPELAPVITHHDEALNGKKLLRLAFHFLDADSMEQVILGGYVTKVRAMHPEAPLPPVHRSDQLIEDAERLRVQMGDDPFFANLNKSIVGLPGGAGPDAWGAVLDTTWDVASYDAARTAPLGDPERQRLLTALVDTYFSHFTSTAEFVDLDSGLAAISAHAKTLGYDAVVMFLDELVLWLAFQVRNREFFGREAQKITKLVESASGPRAIPLVSFIARQLDLRRYFVESGGGVGSEQEAVDRAFSHQEGRFRIIELGDDNLPYVAEKRLLKPVSPEAKQIIDAEFDALDRRQDLWDVLLDGVNTEDGRTGADRQAFRRTYPFSPALVSTLRTLASAMQRDRTALKVMQQLLVNQRAHLTVADVIPVGDVFDLVVRGNQAITPEMAGRFTNARNLYAEKLRPLLLREHQLDEADVTALPAMHAFRADDRLLKTLVLSAVTEPEVPALRELTATRLAALNHGSIVSPLPGQEASIVLAKLRRWSAEVPEIHISSDPRNPVIRMRISEVDYESVVEKARGEDSEGRRREVLKGLVWDAFGLENVDGDVTGVSRQTRIWRGSRREVEVVFANIRDRAWLSDDMFTAGRDTWRFIVDYPFDDQGHGVREDDQRIADLRNRGVDTRTVAWVPHFLSEKRRRELGRLAILDWLLGGSGDRWQQKASDLAPADRAQAKIILENQQAALRETLRRAVQEAYGAAKPTPGNLDVDEAHDKVLLSLTHEFNPQAPVGHDLAAAFTHLVDQAFTAAYPGHPRFEPEDVEVKTRDLAAVLEAVLAARQAPDGRAFVEPARRDVVRRIANQLGVGHMGETHFLFSADRFAWQNVFAKAMGAAGVDTQDTVAVGTLRGWIRDRQPTPGLRPEVADLIVCAWAVQEGRAWYRHGAALVPAPKPGSLQDDMELRPEPLPSSDHWALAVQRAGGMLGVLGSNYLTGTAVSELATNVRTQLGPHAGPARQLPEAIASAYHRLGLPTDPDQAGRLATARAVAGLAQDLQQRTDNVALVESLARTALPCTDQAAGRSLAQGVAVMGHLQAFDWEKLRPLLEAEGRADERGRDAKARVDRLRAALTADELSQPLAPALQRAVDDAFQWLTVVSPPPGPSPKPVPATAHGRRMVRGGDDLDAVRKELEAFVDEHLGKGVVVEWRVES